MFRIIKIALVIALISLAYRLGMNTCHNFHPEDCEAWIDPEIHAIAFATPDGNVWLYDYVEK